MSDLSRPGTMTEPLSVPYRERERSVTMEPMREEQTSSSRSTSVRITRRRTACCACCTMEGEIIREMKPIIGYVHTGIEKSCEDQAYWKVIPFVERMDYLAYYFNAMAYCIGRREAARPRRAAARAVPARDPPRAEPDRLAPVLARHLGARPRRGHVPLVGHPRARPRARPVRDVERAAHAHALLPDRRRRRGHPAGLGAEVPRVHQDLPRAPRPVRGAARQERDLAAAHAPRRDRAEGATCSSSA